MTHRERIEALERKLADMEARLASVEARPIYIPYYPYPSYPQTYYWTHTGGTYGNGTFSVDNGGI